MDKETHEARTRHRLRLMALEAAWNNGYLTQDWEVTLCAASLYQALLWSRKQTGNRTG